MNSQGERRADREQSATRRTKRVFSRIRSISNRCKRAFSPSACLHTKLCRFVRFSKKLRIERTCRGHAGDMRGTSRVHRQLVVLDLCGRPGDILSGRRTNQRSKDVAKPIPICPRCGQPATQTLKPTGLKSRCEPCGLWSRGSKPLRDEAGHQAHIKRLRARQDAHLFFDPLWKEGLVDRDTAYELLAQELGIERDSCHMSQMDFEVARLVPRAVKAIRAFLAIAPSSSVEARVHGCEQV